MTYTVLLTTEGEEDLERLFECVLERELSREDGRLELAAEALGAIRAGLKVLERFPFTCRKVGESPFLRELITPFGAKGCVALFEIVDNKTVVVAAVRHQREDDYH
jgi:plasmid stabilization system protein ParE